MDEAYQLLSPLHGLADLRHADSHLPSSETDAAFALCGIDPVAPHVVQGEQLIAKLAATLAAITTAFPEKSAEGLEGE